MGVMLGKGDGTFGPAVTYDSGEGYESSVAVADVKGDGKLDVLAANLDAKRSACYLETEMAPSSPC